MSNKKLKDMPEKCSSNVQQYLINRFNVHPTTELIHAVFSDHYDFWDRVMSFDKISGNNQFGVVCSSTLYHVFFARLTGYIAPHVLGEVDLNNLKEALTRDGLLDNLYDYDKVIKEALHRQKAI